jgi:hypothetical protein
VGSVYRQTGRRRWIIKYMCDGRPITVSTGTTDQRRAEQMLRDVEQRRDRVATNALRQLNVQIRESDHVALSAVRERDGIAVSEQVRRALALWFAAQAAVPRG